MYQTNLIENFREVFLMKEYEGLDEKQDIIIDDLFAFYLDEVPLIARLEAAFRTLLSRATPLQIHQMAKLFLGLKNLPKCTPGVEMDVYLVRYSDEGKAYYGFQLSENSFILSQGGYYKGPCGGDSYDNVVVDMELGGYRDGSIMDFAAWIESFEELIDYDEWRIEIEELGESSVDFEEELIEDGWDRLKAYYELKE